MGNIGNLSGIGKMENGGGSGNKLYCVTISNKYSFYSSVSITNATELKSYLSTKGVVTLFGETGNVSNVQYKIESYRAMMYKGNSVFGLISFVIEATFDNSFYQGGSATTSSIDVNYSSITVSCYEV